MQKFNTIIPEREEILTTLKKLKKPATFELLVEELTLSAHEQQEAFHRRLRAMERDGQIIFTRKKCYTLPEKLDLIKGTVIAHRDGYGFLYIGGGKPDLFIPYDQMQKVIHGDEVLVQQLHSDKKERTGIRIVRILKEAKSTIIGRYFIEEGIGFVIPDDNHISFDILVPQEKNMNAESGSIVVVELLQRPHRRIKALGQITEILGKNMMTDIAIDIAIRTHDLSAQFPIEVNQQITTYSDRVSEQEKQGRIDLTNLPLVTIDGEDARDFDDAVHAIRTKNGWKLFVAIADVSHYVRIQTPIDKEAYQRGTSVYFPTKVIPMLPEFLSNGLCSLNPNVDRLCMVCEMDISTTGALQHYQFYEAIMKSHARLTYTEVAAIFEQQSEPLQQYETLIPHLFELRSLYLVLEKVRNERGAIGFETEEPKFVFDKENRIKHVERAQRNEAHKLIEECMIMANVAAAQFAEENKEPILYRVHDVPSEESVTKVRTILNSLGLSLKGTKIPTPKDYANLIDENKNHLAQDIITTILLRSLRQARYQPDNKGHFGLALTEYAHFTSPIRRYPDLLLHRSLKSILAKKNKVAINSANNYTFDEMLVSGEHCSTMERKAEEASRDVINWLKCDFMMTHIGDVFSGSISSVTNFGFFVRLDDLFIDGLVHVTTLENDYYEFRPDTIELVGTASGIAYGLGDKVVVNVDAVHLDERKIDFSLISVEHKLKRKSPAKLKKSDNTKRDKKSHKKPASSSGAKKKQHKKKK